MTHYPISIKEKARSLRSQNKTYREIRQELQREIPKGTLSGWLREVKLSDSYYQKINKLSKQSIYRALEINKLRNTERLDNLRTKNQYLVNKVNKSVGILLLATLYWCEGGKYPNRSYVQFGNTDPNMIRLFLFLLRTCFDIEENKFRLSIQCRADQNKSNLEEYWSQLTHIPNSQMYQTHVDKRSIGKPTQKTNYKGVCVVNYFDTNIQCELQFLGEYLGTNNAIEKMKNNMR